MLIYLNHKNTTESIFKILFGKNLLFESRLTLYFVRKSNIDKE